jgi:hypothetical protein
MVPGRPDADPEPVAAAAPGSWHEVRDWSAALLLSRTGQDVAAWNRRVAEAALGDEPALRAWLAGRGIVAWSVEHAP